MSENCRIQPMKHVTSPFYGVQLQPRVNNAAYGEDSAEFRQCSEDSLNCCIWTYFSKIGKIKARACVLRLCEKSNLAQEIASCTYRIRLKVQLHEHKTGNFLKPSRVFTQSLFLNSFFSCSRWVAYLSLEVSHGDTRLLRPCSARSTYPLLRKCLMSLTTRRILLAGRPGTRSASSKLICSEGWDTFQARGCLWGWCGRIRGWGESVT